MATVDYRVADERGRTLLDGRPATSIDPVVDVDADAVSVDAHLEELVASEAMTLVSAMGPIVWV